MSKSLLFTLTIIFLQLSFKKAEGQTVSIPDPNLKKCILDRYPFLLDAEQNLILSEAEGYTGSLECIQYGIQNAESIQYFVNAPEINLADNDLYFLPQLPDLNKLERLELNDNNIAALPDFSGLTSLTYLDIRRNQLTTLPDLSNNISLVEINAHSNNLTELPSLDALVNLRILNVAINDLRDLPNLDNLSSLRELKAWRNNLTQLPSLYRLDNLEYLDVSTNNIEVFPEFSPQSKIRTIYIERNELESLPDLSYLQSLTKARLYNNRLTFEDLTPLTSISDYQTVFPVTPQAKVLSGKTIEVTETLQAALTTGIDNQIPDVNYEWFYNGSSIQNKELDILYALTSSVSDDGYYYCKITHPAFPDLVLETDTFFVNILPCINLLGFTKTIFGITCLNAGALSIEAYNQPFTKLTYELKSTETGKFFKSESGEFTDLSDPEYVLTVTANNNKCRKELPQKIFIPKKECKSVFITPNGDGVDDSYFFTQTGNATISDKFGNVVKKLSIPDEWNGEGIYGTVAPGLYLVDINDGEEVLKVSVVY